MPTLIEQTIRERLALCGIKRTYLAAQHNRLQRETEQALREARRLGSPTLSVTEAARIAGVSRSVAYSRYLLEREGDEDADRTADVDPGGAGDSSVA